MKKGLRFRFAWFGLLGTLLAPALAATSAFDGALARLDTYDHGQPNVALAVIEREVGRLSRYKALLVDGSMSGSEPAR